MSNQAQQQEQVRAHVFVSGRVQGVDYRFSALDEASRLGINGWVRNLPDRRVEAVFEGSKTAIGEMIRWCHQGPRGALVKDVAVEYELPEDLQGFEIEH